MVSIVSLQGVVALLGRFPALAGADLEVGESEIVLVQGPNGAGKSTLLRVCAGLLRIESGRAEVLGHDLVTDRAAVRRSVGLLGHDTALYDDLTVEENLRFWARVSYRRRSGAGGARPPRRCRPPARRCGAESFCGAATPHRPRRRGRSPSSPLVARRASLGSRSGRTRPDRPGHPQRRLGGRHRDARLTRTRPHARPRHPPPHGRGRHHHLRRTR